MIGLSKAMRFAFLSLLVIGAIVAAILLGCIKENEVEEPTNNGATTNPSIPPIDASAPARTETATFALGCFWSPDSRFGIVDGVIRTRVGYAGGTTKEPTYYNLGDHTETVQIDYDPTRISYEQLLEIFWDSHNTTVQPWSRQYMSVVFYHSESQRRLAISTKEHEEARLGQIVLTEIVPFSEFFMAEDYHQKYRLQLVPELMKEFVAIYPNFSDFVDSTAVARINGYLGVHGNFETLREQLSSFGLSSSGNEIMLELGAN